VAAQTAVATADESSRRDFQFIATGAVAAVGAALALWPFIDNMNPDAAARGVATIKVDLRPIATGQRISVFWRGGPVFIDHRTPERIAAARADDHSPGLIDPATDASRVKNPEWLIVIGVCTHLGCIPLGQAEGDPRGDFGGWFCPCHGSQYDTSGRVGRSPAPRNLEIPPYEFLQPDLVEIA
jgi:ubiquinol-cytochrome c reductase iron-sulfur subunit